jgi:hypothetical protein
MSSSPPVVVVVVFVITKLCARDHIEIILSKAARAIGVEVQCRAVAGQRRGSFFGSGIDNWAQIDRDGPPGSRPFSRRDPQIDASETARAVGGEEEFQPIIPDGRSGIAVAAAQFVDGCLRHSLLIKQPFFVQWGLKILGRSAAANSVGRT